jgi:hypothetical protein
MVHLKLEKDEEWVFFEVYPMDDYKMNKRRAQGTLQSGIIILVVILDFIIG